MTDKVKPIDIISVVALISISATSVFLPEYNQIFLYFIVPFLSLNYIFNFQELMGARYFKILCCLFIWMLICSIPAYDLDAALAEMKRCLGVVLVGLIIICLSHKRKLVPWLYVIFIVQLLSILYYAQTNILLDFDYTSDRANDETVNANSFAYYTFYATISLYVLGLLFQNKWSTILRWAFLMMIPITFFIAIITASRQVLIIQIPTIFFLICSRYKILRLKNLVKILFVSIVLVVAFYNQISEIYQTSYLYERSQTKIEDDSRFELLKEAVRVGIENPICGVGPGCFGFFNKQKAGGMSHCSYTDLFADCGIIGAAIYVYLLFIFVRLQFIRYRETKDSLIFCFLIFGAIFGIYNFFYVFYRNLWLMSMFVLISEHSNIYYRENYLTRNCKVLS